MFLNFIAFVVCTVVAFTYCDYIPKYAICVLTILALLNMPFAVEWLIDFSF